MKTFRFLALKVARELFPAHVDVMPQGVPDWPVTEETADTLEIRVSDRTGPEPRYGSACIDGRLLRSPQLEDAIRHELRHLAREMGYVGADKEQWRSE